MKTLLTILLFVSVTTSGQVTKKISEQTTLISSGQFRGVIFSADYNLPILDDTDKGRFTPIANDVIKLEKELEGRIKEINKNRPNQGGQYGPIIDKKLDRYSRQYAGFINDKGERIIHVGLNWKETGEAWKADFILVFDGGSHHWTIRYNLDKDEFFRFGVNGIASLPIEGQHYAFAPINRSDAKNMVSNQSGQTADCNLPTADLILNYTIVSRRAYIFFTTSDALCPPNPNVLLIATFTTFFTGDPRVRFKPGGTSGSTVDVLMVAGMRSFLTA